jgi:membrane associated rhomboid family serine protease
MSWQDRPYAGGDEMGGLRIGFRRPSSVVTWIIVANAAVFVLDLLSQRSAPGLFLGLFGLSTAGITHLFVWQPITYMFMHGSVMHLVMNMLMLYICGSEFERRFGPWRFLQFYFTCGVVGGLAYVLLGEFNEGYRYVPLVGASGAVYGLLIAAIILFPHIQVVLFIFPMPIRVFGLIMAAILLMQLISPGGIQNTGGEVCHMAGAATGVGIFYLWGVMPKVSFGNGGPRRKSFFGRARRTRPSEWIFSRNQQTVEEEAEVDRILEKVHQTGIQSLTRGERKTLSRATQRQRQREGEFDRVDRL